MRHPAALVAQCMQRDAHENDPANAWSSAMLAGDPREEGCSEMGEREKGRASETGDAGAAAALVSADLSLADAATSPD